MDFMQQQSGLTPSKTKRRSPLNQEDVPAANSTRKRQLSNGSNIVITHNKRKTPQQQQHDIITATPSKKRKLDYEDDLAAELEELATFNMNWPTKNSSQCPTFSTPSTKRHSPVHKKFIAICDYKDDGEVGAHFLSKDLKGIVADLWERIDHCAHNIWSEHKGDEWLWGYQRSDSRRRTPFCITRAVQGRRTKWHPGSEGVYACKDCVQMNLPCFAFMRKDDGDLWLLPLHKADRRKEITEGKETRWWINDDAIEGTERRKSRSGYGNATDARAFVVDDRVEDSEEEFTDDEADDENDDGSDDGFVEISRAEYDGSMDDNANDDYGDDDLEASDWTCFRSKMYSNPGSLG